MNTTGSQQTGRLGRTGFNNEKWGLGARKPMTENMWGCQRIPMAPLDGSVKERKIK